MNQNSSNQTKGLSKRAKIIWGIIIAVAILDIATKLLYPEPPSPTLSEYEKKKAEEAGRMEIYLDNN